MSNHDPLATAIAELTEAWLGTPLEFYGPVSEAEIDAAERELGVVFPRSYRTFLRHYGAGSLYYYDIFGLPSDGLWGSVVTMNRVGHRARPGHFVKFTDNVAEFSYYLDTSRMDPEGECPVVVFGPGDDMEVIADTFLDFLRKVKEDLI